MILDMFEKFQIMDVPLSLIWFCLWRGIFYRYPFLFHLNLSLFLWTDDP